MTSRRTPTLAPCWCRCMCHTAQPKYFSVPYGDVPCGRPNRTGRCTECRRECNPSRPQDRPNNRPNRAR